MSFDSATNFAGLWDSLLPIGRDGSTGGYRRFSWTPEDQQCRDWFTSAAAERGLRTYCDRNGNLWAWWDGPDSSPGPASAADAAGGSRPSGLGVPPVSTVLPRAGAIVTGSHLDSVPDGGAFDGPLGVVSAFAAIDLLRERGVVPARPVAVAAFCEEEGARFGVACLGSRLLTRAITPEAARGLRDGGGITLADAMAAAGHDPGGLGPDEELLASIGAYVELHVEQGRALADLDSAIGIAEGIWPHGRWRLDFTGQADHAGTAALAGRHDPMLPYAAAALAARQAAAANGTLATFGKVVAEPGGANAVCSTVTAWLDARAPQETALRSTVDEVLAAAERAAGLHGVTVAVRPESITPPVTFDLGLRETVAASLAARGITAPVLPTGAGHDAGVLSARLPAAMLFVRNPSGVSHAPAEHADAVDCAAGVEALAAVLHDLASR
ncbi:MAG: beta-ureidopropionase / N-carbamoyl-L-amino-acid hydrolase [Streptosporangiaceae bacterium]|jgi:N-carbamoyl-L-amino-acid hydrolase|nr:beta-ureidopropionase / N-carbamoyl-L-amino-acid hydrolase [Streptosporangiaceae bacterium]